MCSTKPPNSRRFTGPTVKLGSSTTEAVSMSQPSDLVINPERRDAQMILVMVSTAAVNLPTAWSSSGPRVTGTRGPDGGLVGPDATSLQWRCQGTAAGAAAASNAVALHQPESDGSRRDGRARIGNASGQPIQHGVGEGLLVEANRGQRGRVMGSFGNVVVAHHADVLGHPKSRLRQCVQGTESQGVGEGEQRLRRLMLGQPCPHRLVAAVRRPLRATNLHC